MALTDTFIKQVKHTGKPAGDKYADGGGMFLLVKAAGKYWRLDYAIHGKRKTLALGVYPAVSLAQARQLREQAKKLLAQDIDPGQAKREQKLQKRVEAANTFKAVAEQWLKATAADRSERTQDKARQLLEKDVYPSIGAMPIASIAPRDVLAVVRKVEAREVFETAHRVHQLCGRVFRFAVAEGSAERDVTADLKGALHSIEKEHFAAITEPAKLAPLLRSIHAYEGHAFGQAALKLAPLVFLRPGELRSAEWAEIDLEAAEWRIPAAKMKMRNDHIVPLSTQAVAILRDLHLVTGHRRFVFPNLRGGDTCMSANTINSALRAMGYPKEVHTAHGFRATARTILDEVLGERVDLIEHQLAHAVKDANGRAYNRTAHLPARREMMQRWADYLDKLRQGAEVLQFKVA